MYPDFGDSLAHAIYNFCTDPITTLKTVKANAILPSLHFVTFKWAELLCF